MTGARDLREGQASRRGAQGFPDVERFLNGPNAVPPIFRLFHNVEPCSTLIGSIAHGAKRRNLELFR